MRKVALLLLVGALQCSVSLSRAAASQTPPMGWNSYDAFNFSVTEDEFKANVDTIAKKYLPYGWNYAVVDWCWSFPGMGSQGTPNQGWTGSGGVTTRLNMDTYGRPMPDTVRHPSSRNGVGFKALADYTHSKGLKFGIHLMRGMYRQAYWANTPVLGTSLHAKDITDITSTCPWLDHTYGLKMDTINGKIQLTAGAQAYLNSLLQLFASWGVDFLKVDDLGAQIYHTPEIEGYRKAIDSSGREMVFSTSPGATPLVDSAHVASHANQWRMANDLWDTWTSVNAMFALCNSWYKSVGPGHFPDADMIPIGRLSKRGPNGSSRFSNLTRNEQYTVMTLWSIFRSPMIYGGNPAENRPAEDSLMTNADVIAMNQSGSNPHPIATGTTPVWASNSPDTNIKYCALFNLTGSTATVSVALSNFGAASWGVKNIWTGADLGTVNGTLSVTLPSHASALYKLTTPGYVPVAVWRASKSRLQPAQGATEVYEIRGRHIRSVRSVNDLNAAMDADINKRTGEAVFGEAETLSPIWLDALRLFWIEEGFDPSNKSLLVAVSGGCDSIALLELFHSIIAPEKNCRLSVVHINHRLRSDSDADQLFVEQFCVGRNIPIDVEILDPAKRAVGESVEMWARENRYRVFARAQKKFNADFTLTAHHRDDVVETFCLRIWRGTGFAGMAAIPFKRSSHIIRPLLPVGRIDLKDFLIANKISWHENDSNNDLNIPRNWVRHRLLPEWRGKEADVDDRIFRITREVAKLRVAWEQWLAETYPIEEVRARGGIPMDWLRDGDVDSSLLRHLLPVLGVDKPVPEVMTEILRQSRQTSRGLQVRVNESTVLAEKNDVLVSIRITKQQ